MISGWLHLNPALMDDDEWALQYNKARFFENRIITTLAAIMGAEKKN